MKNFIIDPQFKINAYNFVNMENRQGEDVSSTTDVTRRNPIAASNHCQSQYSNTEKIPEESIDKYIAF